MPPEKVFKADALVTDAGAKLFRRRIVAVDFDARTVCDETCETHAYGTLFLATGANPVLPPVPGSRAGNVFTVKTQADMERILAALERRPRRAVVIGGGVIGAQFAARSSSVTDKVDVVSLAIQRGLTLRELASLSYSAQPWQSHYPAGNAIVDACEDATTRLR